MSLSTVSTPCTVLPSGGARTATQRCSEMLWDEHSNHNPKLPYLSHSANATIHLEYWGFSLEKQIQELTPFVLKEQQITHHSFATAALSQSLTPLSHRVRGSMWLLPASSSREEEAPLAELGPCTFWHRVQISHGHLGVFTAPAWPPPSHLLWVLFLVSVSVQRLKESYFRSTCLGPGAVRCSPRPLFFSPPPLLFLPLF